MEFRVPRSSDWREVLSIANHSVAHVHSAGTQEEWLRNRRTFSARGDQAHFVVTEHDHLLGYGSLEREAASPTDEYRAFVVVHPNQLDTTGSAIYRRLEELMDERQVTRSWFVEYAQDIRFIEFIGARGYVEARRFMLASGAEAVVLSKDHRRAA
jgi:hypothetical protein